MKKTLLIVLAFFLGAIQVNAQYFVDIDATGNNDGSSWANAYNNLDSALHNWDVALHHQEIWVAEGVYTPGDGVNRNSAFLAKANMFGGFNGTETSRGQRDISGNPTILSGDLLGNDNATVSATEATRSDNSYSVIYTNSATQINGFFIEGGQADASSGSDQTMSGAAVYNYNNGTKILNCIIRNNFGNEDGAIVKFRGPTNINSWFTMNNNEFYNNVSYRSQVSSTRPATLTHTAHMYMYNNLFHHNEVQASKASIILATTHVNGGSLSMGDYRYIIYHNTFANNTIPSTGATIGHGRNDISNGGNAGWCDLVIQIVGNIIWDDAPTLVANSIVSGSIENSTEFYFAQNVVKGTDSIQTADLLSDIPYVVGNVYDKYPMFEDTSANNYRILYCTAPGNDLANFTSQDFTVSNDFYGNPREVGFSNDAGHCEVQQQTAAVSIQQVGTTLEATSGFAAYNWVLGQQPYTSFSETSNVFSPTAGDGPYIVVVIDTNLCKNYSDYNFCGSVSVSLELINDTLFATGVGGSDYVWYVDGNLVSGANNEFFVPTSPGRVSVNHYLFDGVQVVGCTGSASYEITCDNEADAVITESNGVLSVSGDFTSYQWMEGGTNLNGETGATFTPVADGDYQVTVIGNFGCAQNSPIFSYCSSVSVSITLNNGTLEATTGFASYQWYLVGGSGTGIAGATSATYSPTVDGDYYVTASDGNCAGTSNTVSYQEDVTNSIESLQDINFKVYPNPSNGVLNIEADFSKIKSIRILDLSAKTIMNLPLSNRTVNTSSLQAGLYLLEVRTENSVMFEKIIVQ